MLRPIALVVLLALFTAISSSAQDFWLETAGPTLGTVSLATNSKGHVFAGTENSSIHRSLNWGATWEQLGNGLPSGGVNWPVRDISIAANDEIYIVQPGSGVYRSVDNGNTWQSINAGLSNPAGVVTVHAKALPNGMTQVYIGSDGLSTKSFLSDNSGATWIEIPLPGVQKTALYETFISPNSEKLIVSIGYNKGLFRTKNRGQRWFRIDTDSNGNGLPGGSESDDNYNTIRANAQGHIFVGRSALEESTIFKNACIMRSTNDGETYEYITNGWDPLLPDTRTNNRVMGITFGTGSDVYATTEKAGMYFSSNNGATWTDRNSGLPGNGASAALAATPNNHIFAAPFGFYFVFAHLDPTMSVENLPAIIKPVVSASPNPANDVVSITFDLTVGGLVRAEVVATDGSSVVQAFTKEYAAGPQAIHFSTNTIAPGAYAWRLIANGSTRTGRFIVAR